MTIKNKVINAMKKSAFVAGLAYLGLSQNAYAVEPAKDPKEVATKPSETIFDQKFTKYFGSQEKPDSVKIDFREFDVIVTDRNKDGKVDLAAICDTWTNDYSKQRYKAIEQDNAWKPTGKTYDFAFKEGIAYLTDAKGNLTTPLALDLTKKHLVQGLTPWDDLCDGKMSIDSKDVDAIGVQIPEGKKKIKQYLLGFSRRAQKGRVAYLILKYENKQGSNGTVEYTGNQEAIEINEGQHSDLVEKLCNRTNQTSTTFTESKLPRSYLRGSIGYGLRNDTITTTTTDSKGVKVADDVEKLVASGLVLDAEGRINFEKLLNLYLAGDVNAELFNRAYKLTNTNGKATAGYLGRNLGVGAGYGISRKRIQNLEIGDGFTADVSKNYSGPVLEAILRGDSTEARIAASFMKGSETQDLRNSQVPGYVRTTGDNSASLKTYQALVRQILGKNVEADLTGKYSESKSFGRETSEGQLGLEGKYNWKAIQLGAGLKAGKQLKGSNGVNSSYQQIYGSAGFRF